MVKRFVTISVLVGSLVLKGAAQQPGPGGASSYFPISLDKSNPHYFTFRGKPTILITSAEHYGSVINLDFDYVTYLDILQNYGFNLTRIFLGDYVSAPGFFDYPEDEPLTPAPGRLLAPWARSSAPGYANGGNKFDLSKWDETYFKRLRDFIAEAGKRGIVVEVTLFCPYYANGLSPCCSDNNIQGLTSTTNTLGNTELVAVQDAMVEKVVAELKGFDNIYYEACNEPYHGGGPRDWQDHIIQKIVDAESTFKQKHLIAQGIANYTSTVTVPNPHVSIFNWHYAYLDNQTLTGDIVSRNYKLNGVLGNDETGTTHDNTLCRREGWETIIAGCGVYNNLDLSFLYTDESGSTAPVAPCPNGGGPECRGWIKILKDFIYGFDFIAMKTDNSVIVSGVPGGARVRALVREGRQYAIYIRGGSGIINLEVELPEGKYQVQWLNTKNGNIDKTEKIRHKGGALKLTSPSYSEDIALSIKK
ncbi:MAG: hypothetical protein JXR41_13075 [Bacteroidales bacterium]|nr:hypothetical protein [Bacteroidales bacterium]